MRSSKSISFALVTLMTASAYGDEPTPIATPAPDTGITASSEPAPAPAPAPDLGVKDEQPTAGWKDGFFIAAPDGSAKLKLGGYLQADSRWFVGDDDDKLADQFTFRRLRLDIQGTIYKNFEFRFLPDFAGSKIVVQDAWVDVNFNPAIRVKVGKFKEPFGLERLQSATSLDFVERGLPTLLVPNRDVGVQVWGDAAGGVASWAVGAFNGVADGQSGDGDVSDDKEFAARLFISPFAKSKGKLKNIGAGGAITFGDKQGTLASPDVAAFKTTGQATFFTPVVGADLMTTTVASGAQLRYTGQGYAYVGPVGLLGEYVHSTIDVALGDTGGDITAQAWQVAASFVLTGEDASYKGVAPKKPLDPSKHQWGAFELSARVHGLSVEDAAFDAGFVDPAKSAREAFAVTGGLRWHASKGFRVYLDGERTSFKGGASAGGDRPDETVILPRVQTVF